MAREPQPDAGLVNLTVPRKEFLFVCGVARSGTTTMADLLRTHPAVAMGRERYAWRFKAANEFCPALFTKERFCVQFSPEDSHQVAAQPYYLELLPRFDQCVYVGDKLPNLYQRYRYVLKTFPGCRIIYMARNVFDVAASFQERARKTSRQISARPDLDVSRRWPAARDWRQAIEEWNEAVENTLNLDDRSQLFVVDYDLLYREDALLDRLFAFLRLPLAPAVVAAWEAGKGERQRIEAGRAPQLSEDQVQYIRRHAHLEQFDQLMMNRG